MLVLYVMFNILSYLYLTCCEIFYAMTPDKMSLDFLKLDLLFLKKQPEYILYTYSLVI